MGDFNHDPCTLLFFLIRISDLLFFLNHSLKQSSIKFMPINDPIEGGPDRLRIEILFGMNLVVNNF
jgi:hypothetical protein